MTEIRRADPGARRQVTWLLIVGTLVGILLILGFERYRASLREWIGSDPRQAADRITLALVVVAVLLSAPVLAFAAYLWAYGGHVLRTQQCPPPGYRVLRDTPVIVGLAARMRGLAFRVLAACLGVASIVLGVLLWRLARTLAASPPT